MKTIKCKYCKEPLCEAEIEQYKIDGKRLCFNWEKEVE